ncbi:Epidermal growth factor-like protein 6 [Channa argus]|uniref:Epidermal growth factor-like protein 6 n=1 Tax=Channa argus TaxID=215402 RepID=A0A6G1Q6Z5_CHAAH|nr:Epidermal growth factor-like protein 6 [Channa argus]
MLNRVLVLLSWLCMRSQGQLLDHERRTDHVLSSGLCRYGNSVECCWGWRQMDRGRCQPYCEQGCKHGECVGPDRCKCHPGYTSKACNQDLNECGLKPRPCKHRCMNTLGSYKCYCLDGYTLQADGSCRNTRTCYHANCQYGCEVIKGLVRCTCPSPGLQLGPDRRTCVDINECISGGGGCPHRRKCVNTFGSFVCKCHLGFKLTYINGRYTCIDKDTRSFCSLNPTSPKCRCEDGNCKAPPKVTLDPYRPRTTLPTSTTTPKTPATTTTPSTTATTIIPATTITPKTTPATTTKVETATSATTTTPAATTTPATTTPSTTATATIPATTTTPKTTPATTTKVAIETSATTTTLATTTTPAATTTPATTTPSTTAITTIPASTTTPGTTTTSATTTTPKTTPATTTTPALPLQTTTSASTTTPPPLTTTTPDTTTQTTPTTTTTSSVSPTTTMLTTVSLVTTTMNNMINKDVTQKQRGDVHIPRHHSYNQLWEFDIELGNTDDYARDDSKVGVLHCTFDHGVCDWMSDREGDVHWETTHNSEGHSYLSVPELKAGQRSIRGARLGVQIAPPWSQGDVCFSFSHWLTGNHVGVLQLFVRTKGRGQRYSAAIWSRTIGYGWRQTQVTLTTYSVDKVLLKAERRRGHRGQIAVDDITLRQGACR